MSFSSRLKEARLKKGLTQAQLGRLIGVANTTISGYEKGTSQADEEKIIAMMRVLDVDANYLWQDNMPGSDTSALTQEESALIKKNRALDERGSETEDAMLKIFQLVPPEDQEMVLQMIEAALRSKGLLE